MGSFISMLLAVASIWVLVEVYTNGVNGAFDGALARFGGESSEEATRATAPQRAGRAVESAFAAGEERRRKVLGD